MPSATYRLFERAMREWKQIVCTYEDMCGKSARTFLGTRKDTRIHQQFSDPAISCASRARFYLFRRPDRRYVPLERGERLNLGSRGDAFVLSGGRRCRRVRGGGSPGRRTRRDGCHNAAGRFRPARAALPREGPLAGLCAAALRPDLRADRHDRNLQTPKAGSGERRLRSRGDEFDPIYVDDRSADAYALIDEGAFAKIQWGEVRF